MTPLERRGKLYPVANILSRGEKPKVSRPETRLIAEYVATKFPGQRVAMGVPLGPAIDTGPARLTHGQALAASRPWRPEVDALVWRDGVLLLIEAKIANYVDGLAKLPLYKSLVVTTPELAEWVSWEVRMRLVVPRAKAWIELMAEAAGVEIDLFEPAWISDYYDYRDRYWTKEYRERREEILRLRRELGVE